MDYPEIPGYTIVDRLGEGGMATVYLAKQNKFDRLIALKVMALHLAPDPSFGERFLREAHIVAQMSHRNFVPVFDVGEHEGLHYMSMEYLPNGDLKGLMSKGLPLHKGLQIAKEVASGLNYAASKNFVHRDIKPENILFREDNSAVICDFGIARPVNSDTQMTVVGTVVGTAYYMSPEQALAESIDGRSDLYNLAVVMYEMLAGHVPYEGESAIAVSIKHVNEEIPHLPERLAAFQPFFNRALAKDPDDRFQTGRELIEALEDLEEREDDLITELSATMLVEPEMTRQLSAIDAQQLDKSESATRVQPRGSFSARRTSGPNRAVSGRRRRVRGRKDSSSQSALHADPGSGSKARVIVPVVVLALLGGGLYWYENYQQPGFLAAQRDKLSGLFGGSKSASRSDFGGGSEKARELNDQALEALEDGRLFEPAEDSAQYYLTTLLALYPDNEQAQSSIARLYGLYLEDAEKGIEQGSYEQAEMLLDQASQISYYISDAAAVERQGETRKALILARQQEIIADERVAEIARLLEEAAGLVAEGALTTPAEANAYDNFQQVLSLDPANESATRGIEEIAGSFLQQAAEQADNGEFARARASMAAAAQIFPRHPDIEGVRDRVVSMEQQAEAQGDPSQAAQAAATVADSQLAEVEDLLAAAEEDIEAYRLKSPSGNNALEKFNRILEIDPASEAAVLGIEKVATRYIRMAQTAIVNGRLDEAATYLDQARELSPGNAEYTDTQNQLIAAQEQLSSDNAAENELSEQAAELLAQAEADVEAGRLFLPPEDNAMLKLRQVLELDPESDAATVRQQQLLTEIQVAAEADIGEGRYERAQAAVDFLATQDYDPTELQALRDLMEVDVSAATAGGDTAPVGQAGGGLLAANSALDQVVELSSSGGSAEELRATLLAAYRNVEEARVADDLDPGIATTLARLESLYAEQIQASLDAGELVSARALLDDAQNMVLPAGLLTALEISLSERESEQSLNDADAIEGLF